MRSRNQRALAIVAVAGLAGAAWGQVDTFTTFGERLIARSYQDTMDVDMLVETSAGSVSKATIQVGGFAIVEAMTEGIPPGCVTLPGCVLCAPCNVPGDAVGLGTPSPSFTMTPGTSVGDSAYVNPLANCIMPATYVPQVTAAAGAWAGLDTSGNGIGSTTRITGRASADSCWRTNVQSGTCCVQGKTTQREYGIALVGAIQTFEVTRPSMTPTVITTTHTLSYESESNSYSHNSLAADGCPGATPMCPSVSPMSDTVIFIEITGKASGVSGVIDSDIHQGALVAREDGTFDLLGELDDPSFDPSSGPDTIDLDSSFSGLIDEVEFETTSIQTTLEELLKGDVDGDGDVDGCDRIAFYAAYTSNIGDANYTIRADFDLDGDVDGTDRSTLLATFATLGCTADLDCDGALTIFDQTAFTNAFGAMDPVADWDGDGSFTIFDYNGFGNTFGLGCP